MSKCSNDGSGLLSTTKEVVEETLYQGRKNPIEKRNDIDVWGIIVSGSCDVHNWTVRGAGPTVEVLSTVTKKMCIGPQRTADLVLDRMEPTGPFYIIYL